MTEKTFAQRVREAAQELGAEGGKFSLPQLSDRMGIQAAADHKRLTGSLRDFFRRREIEWVGKAEYRLAQVGHNRPANDKETMWRVLRMRQVVTAADLQELAGVSEHYAKEFLRALGRRQVVRRLDAPGNLPHSWQLIKDQVAIPETGDKARSLRAIRRRKALESLGRAEQALAEARTIMSEEEEDHE